MVTMSELVINIENIKKRIQDAALRVGRNPEKIKLVAVTKTVEIDVMKNSILEGISCVGENNVQEIERKYSSFDQIQYKNIEWHMIGHLQTNKVKYIIDKVHMIHSVDRYKLALEINKQAQKCNKIVDILVQVNISGEKSKFGVNSEECETVLREIALLKNLKVRGLMTMAPFSQESEQIRPVFQKLKHLSIDITDKNIDNIHMDYLSMGMTGDFEVAIEEGANIVRIGRGIFGKRIVQ